MGAVTALGAGVDVLWEGLLAGRTGLAPVRRFATDGYLSSLAGCIPALDAEHPCSRLDALIEMLFDGTPPVPADTMLFTASTKAGIDQLERAVRKQPTSLDRILGGEVADLVARRLGLEGPRRNISAACASATIALTLAASCIGRGEADSVLVCGLDLVSEFVFSGFSSLHALSPGACRPFDVERDGLLLGEGAAYLLMMSEQRRQREERPSLGRVVGWGMASDAHHITAPSRTGEGLILAIRRALSGAGVTPSDIAAISAHGTGSVYNDAMELTAFGAVFDPVPAFHSVKGALGHTMGACGAVEAIVGLCSLKHQCLPPTVGLRSPEPGGGARVRAEAQPVSGDSLLTTNSGFGGINACVILKRDAEHETNLVKCEDAARGPCPVTGVGDQRSFVTTEGALPVPPLTLHASHFTLHKSPLALDVRGIGWVTPAGLGSGGPGETFSLGPGRLPALRSKLFLDTAHPRFGRFDTYAKAGFAAIALALRSAGLGCWTHKRPIGLVAGTRQGCLEADLAYFETAALHGGTLASPNLFAYTLPSCMLGEASIQFGLTGPSFVIDDADDHLAGVRAAADLLRRGFCETVVAGWCDVNAGAPGMKMQGACGAVFFVLSKGSDVAAWQWDGRQLSYGAQRVGDIAELARSALKEREA